MKYILIAFLLITEGVTYIGTASYYHNRFHGRKTATGDIYNKNKLTAASNKFNLGDSLKVVNLINKKEVNVLVNDRMANNGRLVDLSQSAADSLGILKDGVVLVKVSRI